MRDQGQGLADYSQVDMLDVWYKSVNFGAGESPVGQKIGVTK